MFARTERLLLRPAWQEDAPALAAALGDEAIVRNLASAPWPYDVTSAEAFIRDRATDGLPGFLLFQRTGGAPRLIGGAGLGRNPDGGVELGYWIGRPFWGLGYATEAGRHIVSLARTLRIGRLHAGHFVDNPASGAVLRKLGFRPTGDVAPRFSRGRGGDALCALYTHDLSVSGDDPGGGGTGRGSQSSQTLDPDMREQWRQLAA